MIPGQYEDLVTRVTNFQNEDKGLMVLAGDVFDVPIRKDIVHRVVRWQLAKRQQVFQTEIASVNICLLNSISFLLPDFLYLILPF